MVEKKKNVDDVSKLDNVETLSFTVSGVSKEWFVKEFKPDVIENYNNNYISKIISDHYKAKQLLPLFNKILIYFETLNYKFDELLKYLEKQKEK